jgi:predicted ATP-grasp superfamily ATP-dependent carboligase
MRRQTPFTVEEAKAYIIESVTEWDVPGQTDKIISLAGYAYNRRNKKASVSDAVKLKDVKKNIKALEQIVKRNTLRGFINIDLYEKEIERLKAYCVAAEAKLHPKVEKENSSEPPKVE